jgi:hypothetical protein
MASDHECACEGSRDDAHSGGGEGVRWRQVMNSIAKGAGTTHNLETERECDGVRSIMDAIPKQAKTTHILRADRERDGVRS